ncbi:GDSL-type esterase/lipase family protein [Limnoglobus roseus]|uniref:Putative carbohydrate esterase n=1 Tax=Limnoglobus roseus TaxID=2598579 RepID=A0A5C1AE23_9BACT|nr:GDSL-type esterase/lipase family protein [Limnoglobus roseus]QEL16447.1 putative carbohydrate esterase [Limnoglobus roseus]
MFTIHRRPAAILFAVAVCLLSFGTGGSGQDKAADDTSAVKPAERQDLGAKQMHAAFQSRAKKGNVDVLFLGDGITQGWIEAGGKVWTTRFGAWNAANFGLDGDRTQHVLWRIKDGKELDGIDPKVIVLLVGTSNLVSNSADDVAAGVKAIVTELRGQKPKAKILLLGIFPRKGGKEEADLKTPNVAAADELNPKPKQVNAKLAKLDDGQAVTFLDIGDKFLDASGGLSKAVMSDYVHLTEQGYTIWADAISKPVEELLK